MHLKEEFRYSSERIVEDDTYWKRNEMSFVITGITFFFPMGFEALGYFEHYHPRKQLRWQLGRLAELEITIRVPTEMQISIFYSTESCC